MLLKSVADAINYLITISDFNEAMVSALRSLGEATGVDRVYVFENHYDPELMLTSLRFEWARRERAVSVDYSAFQTILYDKVPRWHRILSSGKVIMGLVKNFPESERVFFESRGIISILAVPIVIEDCFWGFVGFEDCTTQRQWEESEVSILAAAAASIGEAIIRKRSQEELVMSEARYRTVVDNVHDILYSYDTHMIMTYISQGVSHFGFTQEEGIGRNVMDFVHPEDYQRAYDLAMESIATGEYRPLSFRVFTRDGRVRFIEKTGNVIKDESGKAIQVVGILHDITERRESELEVARYREHLENLVAERTVDLEEMNRKLREEIAERMQALAALEQSQVELRKAKEFAESCNNARSEFMANISHEVRTPLNTIVGYSELIINDRSLQEAREHGGLIISESEILLNLINELLDLAKVDSGKLTLEVQPFEFRHFMESIRSSMNVRAMKKGIDLSVVLGGRGTS